MTKEEIKDLIDRFLESYDLDSINAIWDEQSNQFQEFWNERIVKKDDKELYDQEIDEIVQILDTHGKGNTKDSHSIGKVMIPQGAWRRLFNQLKEEQDLSNTIDKIFKAKSESERAKQIDILFELNDGNKNNLTGKSGNAINCLLAAYDPFQNLSIVSLNDRRKLLPIITNKSLNDTDSIGDQISKSNLEIKSIFNELGIKNARTISQFVYSKLFKDYWKNKAEQNNESTDTEFVPPISEDLGKDFIFYMEKQLEDFLIENWDKTELGKKYELINNDDGLVSQQYRTEIGIIDILAKDKTNGKYVIIELKKNQTSDDTIGQIARYMGWVEEHLSNGEPSKGIIIAGKYDKRLKYAMRKISDIEVYLYKLDFNLKEYDE